MSRFLVITNVPPWPPTIGSAQRTSLLMRALRLHGDVDLFLVNQHNVPDGETLGRLRREHGCVDAATPWDTGKRSPGARLRRLVRSRMDKYAAVLGRLDRMYSPNPQVRDRLHRALAAKRYDLLVGRYLRPAAAAGALGLAPIILDLDDFDLDPWESRLRSPASGAAAKWVARRSLQQLRDIVPDRLRQCDHVWVTSAADCERIEPTPCSVLPNIPFVEEGRPVPSPRPPAHEARSLLMVAGLKYPVNVRAADRFVAALWPRVRSVHRDATFRIVGSGMSERQRNRWAAVEGVTPVGYVEDLRSEYDRCLFTVVPIFEGGGTKIKVAESLLYGRTAVLTAHAVRGYAHVLRDGESVRIAAGEDELVEACNELLANPQAAGMLARNGHGLVREHFTFDRFSGVVTETVKSLIDRQPVRRASRG